MSEETNTTHTTAYNMATCRSSIVSSDILQSLGRYSSLELSPKQIGNLAHPSTETTAKLLPHLASAAAGSKRPLIQRGTTIFLNMIKRDMGHFDELAAATASLAKAGFRPESHLTSDHHHHPSSAGV